MNAPVLHGFQSQLQGEVFQAWNQGARNVLMRLDTGGGKTVIIGDTHRNHRPHSRVIAHRQELISQLSLALAKTGLKHNIIAAQKTIRAIVAAHIEELGRNWYDPGSPCIVLSVDTAVNWDDPHAKHVTLWTVDEGHHLVDGNKWHTVISRYTHPDCRGLIPTATPKRADGKGLGRTSNGVADVMVQGPPMRWLIEQGFLTDYRVICPPCDLVVLAQAGASGDWSSKQLREAAQRSHIIGDVVTQYRKYSTGKLGVTFSTDVETAGEMTAAYRAAGVRAETLTGKTEDGLRRAILRRFRNREIDQIVAVDIISEGFDLPAIEVVSMARPTQSLALYMQQFGRALRRMAGKDKAIIIDHVANIVRHRGPPDRPRFWTLDRAENARSSPGDAIPYRICIGCLEPYERFYKECPHCGHYPEPAARTSPAAVDGDMSELSPEVLESLRKNVELAEQHEDFYRQDLIATGLPHAFVVSNVNRRREQQDALATLKAAMGLYGGYCARDGLDPGMTQRRFFLAFDVDVMTAQTLGTKDARKLTDKINSAILRM